LIQLPRLYQGLIIFNVARYVGLHAFFLYAEDSCKRHVYFRYIRLLRYIRRFR